MKLSWIGNGGCLHYIVNSREEKNRIQTILVKRGAKVYGETKDFCLIGYKDKDIDIFVYERD